MPGMCVNHPDEPAHRIGPRGGLCDPCYQDFMAKKGKPVNRPVVHQSTEALRELAETERENVAELERNHFVDTKAEPIRQRKLESENGRVIKCERSPDCQKPRGHVGRCPVARPDRRPDRRFKAKPQPNARGASATTNGASRLTYRGHDVTTFYEMLIEQRDTIIKAIASIEWLVEHDK